MAIGDAGDRHASLRVAAAIVHDRGRILAIERDRDGRLRMPEGRVPPGATPLETLHQVVRCSTGFDVRTCGVIGVVTEGRTQVLVVRCAITGIGSDFTSCTTALRWCDAQQLAALVDVGYRSILVGALAEARAAPAA